MRRAAAIVILICLPLCAAFGDIYRSVDAQGHVQYSDMSSPGAVLVSAANTQTDTSNASDNSAASSNNAAGANDADPIHQRLQQEAAARAVQQDTQQLQAQQCKLAQDVYEKSVEARRLYKLDKNGDREYLTDDQAEQERVNNRLAMQTACKNTT